MSDTTFGDSRNLFENLPEDNQENNPGPDDNDIEIPSDPEELKKIIKGKKEADRFIEQLKNETNEIRQELQTRLTVEEMLAKIESKQSEPQQPNPAGPEETTPGERGEEKPDLREEVSKFYREERQRETAEANFKKAMMSLQETYGNSARNALEKTAKDLNVSKDFLNDMATKSPDGLMKLVQGVVPAPDSRPATPPASRVDTSKTFMPSNKRGKSFYTKLRKENPKEYFSQKTQLQMFKDAASLGKDFYEL